MKINNYKQISKILIIRLSSMGDIILTTPLARILRNSFPTAQIDFCCERNFREIYEFNPHVSNIIEYDKKASTEQIEDLKNRLKLEQYDIIIDLQKNLRTLKLINGLGGIVYRVYKNRLRKLLMVNFKINLYKKIIPAPVNYINTVASYLNVQNDNLGLELFLSPEKIIEKNPDRMKIAVAPGAHHATKRLPVRKFIGAINNLLINPVVDIVLIGGVKDKVIADEIECSCARQVDNFSGSKSILKTAEILDSCDLLLTNDTGVMHVAAARQVPVVAIFGSTVREFGFAPYGVPFRIVEKGLKCRPCTNIGRDSCPLGHFNCMELIEPEEIIQAISELVPGL